MGHNEASYNFPLTSLAKDLKIVEVFSSKKKDWNSSGMNFVC
jgi:hypothetical protein